MMATPKARADGEGSIYRDGASWVAAVSYRDPATGQRRQRRAKRATKSEALSALRELRRRADAGQPLRDSVITVATWSQRWEVSALAASDRRATTRATYSTLLKTCVRPRLGGIPLDRLKPSDIEGWLVELDEQGLSSSTRRQALTILGACLEDAVRDGLLGTNPAAKVTRPTLQRTEAKHYDAAQVAALVAAAGDHRLRPLLILLLATGLRRGEALALSWTNVDLTRGELRVRGTLVRTAAGLVVHPPKTSNGWRTVPLSQPAVTALTVQRQQQRLDRFAAGVSWIGSEHVFTTEAGTPMDPRNVSRWFAAVAAKAEVGGSIHTLRHTALTGMALAGIPLLVVSRVAGHESIQVTADLYGHVGDSAARDAVTAAAGALGLV